jgi:hypothetical protein
MRKAACLLVGCSMDDGNAQFEAGVHLELRKLHAHERRAHGNDEAGPVKAEAREAWQGGLHPKHKVAFKQNDDAQTRTTHEVNVELFVTVDEHTRRFVCNEYDWHEHDRHTNFA